MNLDWVLGKEFQQGVELGLKQSETEGREAGKETIALVQMKVPDGEKAFPQP